MNIADMVPPNTMIKLERLRNTATLSVLIMMEPANRPKQPIIAKIVDIDIFLPNHNIVSTKTYYLHGRPKQKLLQRKQLTAESS